MTCPFGEVRQLGFISQDIDRSMAYFVDAWGIGPWFVLRGLASKMLYNGNSIDLDLSIAMANNGELQFEIVQQNNEVRSMYSDALAQCPELHLQHVAVWSDSVVATEAEAHVRGWKSVFETLDGPGRSVFVSHPDAQRVIVEISDSNPFKDQVREAIKEMASQWDGTNPVREGLPDLIDR